jgi:uncharacterized protein (DUF58 family)
VSVTTDSWTPTAAHFRATAVAIVLVTAALVWRRPDLLVIATPFALVVAWSTITRPTRLPELVDGFEHATIREGDATRWRATLTGAVDLATASVDHDPWIETRPVRGAVAVAATGDDTALAVVARSTRWGRRTIERVEVGASSPWAAFRWATTTPTRQVTTLPVPAVFDVGASPRPPDGLIGLHRSTRGGEGNEFANIRAFRAGDRMRRINWARSARADELMVNATWADLDTHVALVLDVTDDFGVSEGIDGRASSLDAGVRASGAIAEHYATRGERVSLRTFGGAVTHSVPPGTGRGQLRRTLDTLAHVRPALDGRPFAAAGRTATWRHVSTTGQMTVMLSPLIAPDALDLAMSLGRQGHAVVVIDTLPDHVAVHDDELISLAWRIRLLERRRELRLVTAAGIPVVRWRGPGSLDQVIRDIARRTTGPRLVRR